MFKNGMRPVHPGEVLQEESFMSGAEFLRIRRCGWNGTSARTRKVG
jgi:hypothetical protein